MRTWSADESVQFYRVVRNDGEVYAFCNTQDKAANVCSALNFQESQINKGAYPSPPITFWAPEVTNATEKL